MIKYDKSKIVFLDTETTGLYPWMGHEVWDIGYITWNGSKWVESEFKVQPQNLHLADSQSLSINRFYDRTSGSGIWSRPEFVAKQLARVLAEKHVVGAIPSFDIEMLRNFFQANNQAPPCCHYHLIDVEALALGWIARRVHESRYTCELPLPWKSEWFLEPLGLSKQPDAEAHTAIGDARKVKEIWEHIMLGYIIPDIQNSQEP